MTFVLVSTVYAVAIGTPSFGNMGPFAVGLALFAMVFAGKSSDTPLPPFSLLSSLFQLQVLHAVGTASQQAITKQPQYLCNCIAHCMVHFAVINQAGVGPTCYQ